MEKSQEGVEKPASKGHFEQENFVNLFLQLGLIALILPVAILVPNVLRHPQVFAVAAVLLCASGFILFSIAKFSLFKAGKYFTFGSSEMTPRHRVCYRVGYLLMIIAGFIALTLLLISRMPMHVQ